MKKHNIIINFFLTILILSTLPIQAQTSKQKKNVLLIMVDDMNDWVGAFGGHPQAKTPYMDALAKKGVIFKRTYCSAPLCNPSRASMLTGYQPFKTGVYGNIENFREMNGFENTITLPQYFEKNGYKTAAAGKIFHSPRGTKPEPKKGSDPGSFQQEHKGNLGVPFPPAAERHQHGIDFKRAGIKGSKTRSFDWLGINIEDEKTHDWKSANYAANFLQEKHDKPFFLACGIFRPHLPLYAPQKYFDMFDEETIQLPKVMSQDLNDVGKIGTNWIGRGKLHKEVLRNNQWKAFVKAYLANLAYADACVGHLLNGLEKSNYKENTIVVLMGDHGWHLGEKEHWSKQTLWEEATKTPLIIYDPSKGEKGVSLKTVSLIDIYPTLIDLCELPKKDDLDGNSFAHLISNPNGKWEHPALTTKQKGNHTLRSEDFRYIVYADGEEELYDHRTDPNEWKNEIDNSKHKNIIQNFRSQLKKILSK